MVSLVAAKPHHCAPLANRMREIDQRECEAMGRSPKEALRYSLRTSLYALTAIDEEKRPLAMMGVVSLGLMSRRGTPWFLGCDEVFRYPRELLTSGPCIIDWWHQDFDTMENLVGAENHQAIRLLGRWGAKFDDEQVECGGMDFLPFRFARDSSRGRQALDD